MSEVEELTGFKRSYIYGLIRKNKFPQSIAIGARIVGWDANSVLEWIEAQKVSE
ncbi:AlpA family phage regulatory protein [Zophobihabitans entericus]|uniref:AlpA family phage regulatory protein n=2 Tax=Zophobihabitans entericus TaxID=1635327 RepID=A0A6G9IFV2_9GAMM|nr:AlpA family phage regulatory protein [Zophobihabitans entericus]